MERGEKFFFDLNNFDDPDPDAPDPDAPPPPPVFSEEDLAKAREESFSAGRQDGLKEAAASREQAVTAAIETIAGHFSALFSAEILRDRQYETESVRLGMALLTALFPAFNDRLGPEAVRELIRETVSAQSGQTEVVISVHPDIAESVDSVLTGRLPGREEGHPSFRVAPDPSLGPGDCRLHWADGGMVRDAQGIADALSLCLKNLLPEEERNTEISEAENHDIKEEKNVEQDSGLNSEPDDIDSGENA